MCRCDGRCTTPCQLLQYRPAEGCTIHGIGTRTELVDEHEGVGGREPQNLAEVSQVCAEGRQTGLDRLLISDVGVDVIEDRNPTLRGDWRRDPRLQHCREESDG